MGPNSVDNETGRDIVLLESRMETVREIMEVLNNPNISRIGVYGMPGVGKTRLLSLISQKATEECLFNEVVRTLQQQYTYNERVLVILDDIWELSSIEILNITGCDHKVVVTSRSQAVLSKIGTQKDFLVEPLQAEEALQLFRKEARIKKLIFNDAYDTLMIQIVEECAGLPLALVEVARALRNRSADEWSSALQQLKEGSYWKLQTSVFPTIKRSYDSLESEETRSIFLLSSLLGTQISYEELLKNAVGLNLVEGNDMEQARSRVYMMMDSLKKLCLLQDGRNSDSAILHDIIYDFAIDLAFRNHMFVTKHDVELTKWPDEDKMMKLTHLSFHGSPPERLNCPELKLLRFSGFNDQFLTTAADTLFEGIKGLEVLGLKEMHLLRLPSSVHLLTHIQTLCLDQCKLGDLTMIGALKSLKILSFSDTNIKQLPKEIRQLTGLCSLDLSNCLQLNVIPSDVLSLLTQLQELNMENSCSVKWGVEIVDENSKTSNASLAELNHLGHLTSLGIHIPDSTTLPNVMLFRKLIRYKISIGQDGWHWLEKTKPSTSRVLQLKLNNAGISPFEDGIKVLLEMAEGLWLAELKGIKNLDQLDRHGFPELKHLHVEGNSDIECIIESVQHIPSVVFPILESFVLKKLINLREICAGQLSPLSFHNLSIVRVECCDMLQFFLLESAARGLMQLKEMELSTCRNMGAIVAGDKVDTEMSDQVANDVHVIELPQLCALTLQSLPQFAAFFSYLKPDLVNSCRMLEEHVGPTLVEQRKVKISLPCLESLKLDCVPKMGDLWPGFRYNYLQPQDRLLALIQIRQLLQQGGAGLNKLKQLIVSNCAAITYVLLADAFTEYPMLMKKLEIRNCAKLTQVVQMEESAYFFQVAILDPFSCLKSLKLTTLPKVVRICSVLCFLEFASLKELVIEDCPEMESFTLACISGKDIWQLNLAAWRVLEEKKTGEQVFVAPDLEKLSLQGLNQIAQICNLQYPANFRNFKMLELSGCSGLKYLFPVHVARGLMLLLEIRIFSCHSLEQIIEDTSGEDLIRNQIVFHQVRTLILEDLPKLVSFCSGHHLVIWSSLKKITVKNCPKIRMCGLGRLLKEIKLQQRPEDIALDRNIENLFELWDSYDNIKEFDVADSEQLNELFDMELQPSYFTKLVQLQVRNCDERLTDFMSILLERSRVLEHLTIKECKSLRHVFNLDRLQADREEKGRYFMQLKTMILLDLPELTSIWNKDPTGGFGLFSLEIIEIMKCDSLKNVFSFSTWAADNLRKLQKLSIRNCDMIEEVVALETQGQETQNGVIEFPLLRDLELVHLSNFIKLHKGKCALNFPSMEILKVEHCPQMNAFTKTTNEGARDVNYPRLQQLQLLRLDNLEEMWQGPVSSKSFTELNKLELDACGKLKYVIPSNMFPELQNLKKVTVMNCDSLEEVFHFDGESHSEMPMVSQLSDLVLTHLPTLMCLTNMEFASSGIFQNLKTLRVMNCRSLKHLLSSFQANCLGQIEISGCEALEQIFMTEGDKSQSKVSFSHLECIALENLPKLSTFSPGASEFPSLKILTITNCSALKMLITDIQVEEDHFAAQDNSEIMESISKLKESHNKSSSLLSVIPSGMLNELKIITLKECELLEQVFDLGNVTDQNSAPEMFPRLNDLILISLPKLIQVWKNEREVSGFQNLNSLWIIHCKSLQRLFSPSTANYLQQLKTLKLCSCENLLEVVGPGEESGQTIKFSKLECLILKRLPRLESFSGLQCTLELPNLRTVRVSKIPDMKMFSPGTIFTPLLSAVYLTFIIKCWHGDLNSTINHLHMNPGNF